MGKIRVWLAFFAAAGVPLMFYLTQRQEQSRLVRVREAAKDRAGAAGGAARDRFGSLTETTRGAAGSVAETAGRTAGLVAERASTVLAAAPVVGARFRQDDEEYPSSRGEDWRRYDKVFS